MSAASTIWALAVALSGAVDRVEAAVVRLVMSVATEVPLSSSLPVVEPISACRRSVKSAVVSALAWSEVADR